MDRLTQKAITRKRILKVARHVIKHHGFDKATVREIAAKAEVSIGTIMAHFKSKTNLFYEVFFHDIEAIAADAFCTSDALENLERKLVQLGITFLDRYAGDAKLYTDFLEHALLARGPWGQKFKQQVEQLGLRMVPWFQQAITEKYIRNDTEITLAIGTFFSVYYLVLIGAIKNKFENLDQSTAQFRALIHFLMKGISI